MAVRGTLATVPDQSQLKIDQEALLLMLNYIEAECARLGAAESAHHAALAAALLPQLHQPLWASLTSSRPQ